MIHTLETLKERATEIQSYLEISCSNNPGFDIEFKIL